MMLSDRSAEEISRDFRSGAVRAVEIAETTSAQIARLDPSLHAFLTHDAAAVCEAASALDEKRDRGATLGPLAGVPIALKDALVTRGVRTTAGSRMLEHYVPPYDATVVAKLRAADALLAGKTNLDEFAMGSSTEHSAFGPSKNPWDVTRSPGGSSGGSAVAVAARMTSASLGSDTGGSIRQPAAFTGVVGVKPTYGRVSRFGLIAFASSLDQVGPFAATVRDAARVLSVIAGFDPRDGTSLDTPVDDYVTATEAPVRGMTVGIPDEYFGPGLHADVETAVRAAISRLEGDGVKIRRVSLPHTRHAVATYYVVATAEASSNLARFDGVRYGLRVTGEGAPRHESPGASGGTDALKAMYGATRDQGFGREVKRRILLGTFVLSAGYYDAYYRKADQVRALIRRDFDRAFAEVDAIVSPTAPTTAFPLGAHLADPLAMYLADVYTLPASLAGLPAMSVPVEPSPSGLPVGLQLVAPRLREGTLFTLGAAVEKSAPPRVPPIAFAPR
jgi:aspartyl-tRNA(Asn)/glutamyl-tRNA(Gln) amidotransferase subunit A